MDGRDDEFWLIVLDTKPLVCMCVLLCNESLPVDNLILVVDVALHFDQITTNGLHKVMPQSGQHVRNAVVHFILEFDFFSGTNYLQ